MMITLLAVAGIIVGILMPACALVCRIGGVHPDLVLVVAVSWCLLRGRKEALVLAAFGGLVVDMQSAGPLGLLSIATVLATLIASIGEINVFRTVAPLPYVTIVAASAAYYLVVVAGVMVTNRSLALGRVLGMSVVPAIGLNLVCMLPAYWLARRISNELSPPTADWSS